MESLCQRLCPYLTMELLRASKDLANLIHHCFLEFQKGRVIPDEEYHTQHPLQPAGPPTGSPLVLLESCGAASVTFIKMVPQYEKLAVILREAFNYHLDHPAAIPQLQNILKGLTLNGKPQRKLHLDSMDPCHSLHLGAELLRQSITPLQLTTIAGLSNLLTYMGTGQGPRTRSFFNSCGPPGVLGRFYSETLQDAVEMFAMAI